MLVLLGVTTVLLRRPIDGNRLAFGLLVTGVSVGVVADLTFNLVQLEAGGRSASWADAVFLVCYVMMIGSAELYWRRPVPRRTTSRCRLTRFQPISPLPYLAVATTYALLLVVALRPWTDPISGLAIGRAAGDRRWWWCASCSRCARTSGSWPRHAARQNEARFRSLVQHSSDVILVTRPDATIRFVSPSATRVFGYDPAAMTAPHGAHGSAAPRGPRARPRFFRDAAQAPGRHGPGRVAVPPAGRLVAQRGDPRDQPAARLRR